ncbi:MAG: hypothetical protein AAB886_00830 [Patescibacteria group bacterium]
MTDLNKVGKRALTLTVVALTILWTVAAGLAPLATSAQVSLSAGNLVRGTSFSTVYYYGTDGMRYTFPNEKTYMTWYSDFSNVVTVSDSQLASISLGGNVAYRPGTYWVKIQSDPKVYAVSPKGVLHWIESEAVASAMYGGAAWNTFIHDVPDTFFADYTVGASLMSATSLFDGAVVSSGGTTYLISGGQRRSVSSAGMSTNRLQSKHVMATTVAVSAIAAGADLTGYSASVSDVAQKATTDVAPTTGGLSISLASDSPSGATLPGGANGVETVKYRMTAGTAAATLTGLVVNMGGIGATGNISNAYLYEGNTRLTEGRSVNSSTRQATFSNLALAFAAGQTRNISVVVETSSSQTASDTFSFGLASAAGVIASGTVSGSFPVNGNTFSMASQNVGTLDINESGTITNPTLGQQGATIGQFNLVASSEDASVRRMRLKIDNAADHSGFAIYQGSTKLADGVKATGDYVDFTLTTPYTILDGNTKIFYVKANVGGQNGDDVRVYIDKSTDLIAVGGDFGFNMAVTYTDYDGDNGCTAATDECSFSDVQGGKITFAFNGPASADVARNSQDVSLLAFSVTAAQEVTIKDLDVIVYGDDAAALDGDADDDGETGNDDDDEGLINGDDDATADSDDEASIKDMKIRNATTKVTVMGPLELDSAIVGGNDATQTIDFSDDVTLAAGASQQWEFVTDIDDGVAAGTAFMATLDVSGLSIEDKNGDALTAGTDIVPSGDMLGNDLVARAATLVIALASAPTGSTASVDGTSNVTAASFSLTAGTASPITISSIKVSGYADEDETGDYTAGGEAGAQVEDLVASCSIYNNAGTLLDGPEGSQSSGAFFLFDNVNWVIPAGVVEKLTVKCNLANPSDTTDVNYFAVDLADLSEDIVSVDKDSNDVDATTDYPNGGDVTVDPTTFITMNAVGSLAVTADSGSPDAAILLTGSSNNLVAKYRVTATNENFDITTMSFSEEQAEDNRTTAESAAYAINIAAVRVSYPDATGATQTASASMSGNEAKFSGLTFNIPANSPKVISVSVDVPGSARDSGGSATSNEKVRMGFFIDATNDDNFRAVGNGSGSVLDDDDVTAVGDDLEGTDGIATYTIAETKPTVSLASGSPSGSSVPGLSEVLRFTVSAASNEDVIVDEIIFKVTSTDNNGTGTDDWNECDTDLASVVVGDFSIYDYANLGTALDANADWTMLESDGSACDGTGTNDDLVYAHLQFAAGTGATADIVVAAGTTKTLSLYFDSTGASAANDDSIRFDIPADPIIAVTSFLDSAGVEANEVQANATAVDTDTLTTDANTFASHGDIVCLTTGTCAAGDEKVMVSNVGSTNTNLYINRGYLGTDFVATAITMDLDRMPSSFVWYDDGATTSTNTTVEDEVFGAYLVKNLPITGGTLVF